MTLPQDPFILLSYVNTQLRDHYSSFADFCDDLDIDPEPLLTKLQNAGFEYDPKQNRFA